MTTEKADFKVSISDNPKLSDYQRALRKATNLTPIYFDQVLNYINNKVEDVELRQRIIAVAKKYPHSALSRFVQNFELIYSTCSKQLNAEKYQEKEKRIKTQVKEITADDLMDIQSTLESDNSDLPVENEAEKDNNKEEDFIPKEDF